MRRDGGRLRLTRRSLLASASGVGTAAVAGCNESSEERSTPTTGRRSETPPVEPSRTANAGREASSSLDQRLSVGNPTPDETYLTVVVEAPGGASDGSETGETPFVRSFDLFPGERRHFDLTLDSAEAYGVVVETAESPRETFEWSIDERLDGLSVTLGPDGASFWRTVRCRGDCSLSTSDTAADSPLLGDGRGRWYAAASVAVQNAAPTATDVGVSVSLDGKTVLDASYELPGRTRVELPVTFRSGTYSVGVKHGDGETVTDWRVPEQPTLVVTLPAATAGCGPANSELVLVNADDVDHEMNVGVYSPDEAEQLFDASTTLEPNDRRSVSPVRASGQYRLRVAVDDGDPSWIDWWSCPPHGPLTVVVDATGDVSVSSSR